MAYRVLSQNNSVTTLEDDQGNVIHIPSVASLAKSTDYTILKVKNSTATLEDGDGNTYRDVPCVVVLADDSSSYTPIAQNNTKATLESSDNNIIHIPSKVVLASSTDFTIVKVNNSTATLEDGSGNIIRDVHCVSMLADESYSITKVNNSTATLSNDGKTIRDVPCIVILAKTSGAVEVIIKGTSPLNLPDAIADSLQYVKAFGGTEQRNLPDNYIERQFIYMMDGSYIWTDIVPESGGKVEMDFQTTTTVAQVASYLGAREPSSPAGNGLRLTHGSIATRPIIIYGFEEGGDYQASAGFSNDTRYKFTYDKGVATVYRDSTLVTSHTFTPNSTCTTPLVINGTATSAVSGNIEGIYLYSFKVWNAQSELVADYVPAVQKGTVPVVGFYDTVSGTFKTATAGTFAAGPEAVPTPDAPMDIVSNNGVLKVKDSELPVGYKRLVGITYDSNTYYETNEKLYGTDTLTIQVSSAGTSGRNLVGAYSGTDDDVRNFSLYLIGGSSSSSYLRYGTQLTRPRCGSTSSARTLVIGPTGTSGFATNVTYDEETFETTDTFWIGALPNSTSAKYDGNIVGNITVSNRLKYIPCERVSDGEIGYYETFTGVFLENQDTGTPVSMGYDTSYMTKAYAVGTVETINMHGKNLFDKDSATVLNLSGSGSNPLAYRADRYGVYIPVEPSTTYTISRADTLYLNLFETAFVPAVGVATTQYTAMGTASTQTITTAATTRYLYIFAAGTDFISSLQIEKGAVATDYTPYYDGGTATAEILLKVGDYQDVQEILSGAITRNIGVKALDGTEDNWTKSNNSFANIDLFSDRATGKILLLCSHFQYDEGSTTNIPNGCVGDALNSQNVYFRYNTCNTVADWKQWLADQNAAGTPVIVVYQLATPTTESVAGQTLQVTAGDNVLEITQASLDNLELEAQYQAAVSLTIQEVEDANLDNNVEVTIS